MSKAHSLKTSLAFITIAAIVLASASVFLITYFKLVSLVDISVGDHIRDVMNTFQIEVDWELERAENGAERLAENEELIEALRAGDRALIEDAVGKYHHSSAIETENISVTDPRGNVLYCLYHGDIEQSLASQECVASAMRGESMSAFSTGPLIRLGAVSAFPVLDDDDTILGVVMVLTPFDDNNLVDDVKGDKTSEYTIFIGDERLSTTLTENGKRMIGTKMNEKIADTVLNKEQEYEGAATIAGNTYTSMYRPLNGSDGKPIGALFCGVLTNEVKAQETAAIADSVIIAVIAAVLIAGAVIIYVNIRIAKPIAALCSDTEEITRGNLSVDVRTTTSNEIGLLSDSIRATVESLRGYIEDISLNLNSMAAGDMNVSIEREYIGDFSSIKTAIEKISDSLNDTLSSIDQAANQVTSASGQVAQGSQSLSQGAAEQASSIEELAASIELISQKISTNAGHADEANRKTHSSGTEIEQVNNKMKELVASMEEIKNTSAETEKIIKTIDDIAFQTNILALNAAVEAARAGEAGKGFAVVADEVRSLAGKSAEAAQSTNSLIANTVAAIDKGSRCVEEVAESMISIAESSKTVAELNEMISKDSKNAAESIKQITAGVDQISGVVQTNAATAEESAAASQELSGQAATLQDRIAQFRLRG